MILIGFLHHRKHPDKVRKAYAYAAVAKAEGAELLYFSPRQVDFKKQSINGYIYQAGRWERCVSPFPDVIYNAGSPEKLNLSNTVKKLRRMIPFTTYSIGNKYSVYERLKADGEFAQYLIPSTHIKSNDEIYKLLDEHQKIVFKPVNGHRGENVYYLEKSDSHYLVKISNNSYRYSKEALNDFLTEKRKSENYLVQPYIKSVTKAGNAYDFRLHTQKNGMGEWVIAAIYPRIGKSGSIVANINSGGCTCNLEAFLFEEFGEKHFDHRQVLEQFALSLSKKLDALQLKLFGETIDELGIDVGIDENGKLWIFEVNWRPGCPPAFYLELDVVRNAINYAKYLVNKRKLR